MAFPHPPDPIALTIDPFRVRWYGIILAAATFAAYAVARRWARERIRADKFDELAAIVVVAGFIGARLYHVLNEPGYYVQHPGEIVAVWNGGLAIHGALIGGVIAAVAWAKRNQVNTLWLLDILFPAAALGQAIGRWGNYVNQELFGRPTHVPWALPVDPAYRPQGYVDEAWFHPTFLYESLGDIAVFGLLVLVRKRWPGRHDGDLALMYLFATSLVRVGTEFLRIDRVPIVFGMRLPLLVALALALAAALILILRHARPDPIHRP